MGMNLSSFFSAYIEYPYSFTTERICSSFKIPVTPVRIIWDLSGEREKVTPANKPYL